MRKLLKLGILGAAVAAIVRYRRQRIEASERELDARRPPAQPPAP